MKERIYPAVYILLTTLVLWTGAGLPAAGAGGRYATLLFVAAIACLLWGGVCKLSAAVQNGTRFYPHLSILLLLGSTALSACLATGILAAGWVWVQMGSVTTSPVLRTAGLSGVAALVLMLVHQLVAAREALFFAEKTPSVNGRKPEPCATHATLDPHFLFNNLNALSYLVQHDTRTAHQFVHKLSNVCKYILLTKEKKTVSLAEELSFLEDYCFLLQIRFDGQIRVEANLGRDVSGVRLLPATLQTVVDYAVKNNLFAHEQPPHLTICRQHRYLIFTHALRPKPVAWNSAKTLLGGLYLRYHSTLNRNVVIQQGADLVYIKIPVLLCNGQPLM